MVSAQTVERKGEITKPELIFSDDPTEKLNEARFEQTRKRTKFIYAGNYLCYFVPGDEVIKVFSLQDGKESSIQLSKYFDGATDIGMSVEAGQPYSQVRYGRVTRVDW